MYVAFLVGGIGSGKSTAARRLESLGAVRVDLDALSREALAPGSPTLGAVAEAFGRDLVDPATGELDRAGLAARAFASPEATELLESIELPAIAGLLRARLAALAAGAEPPACCVVEVPLPDRMGPLLSLLPAYAPAGRDMLRRPQPRGAQKKRPQPLEKLGWAAAVISPARC